MLAIQIVEIVGERDEKLAAKFVVAVENKRNGAATTMFDFNKALIGDKSVSVTIDLSKTSNSGHESANYKEHA